MADCGARGARAFPGRFLGAFDETAIGGAILPPRETVDLMDVVEQHEAEDLAEAGHRWQQIQGMGVMVRGSFDDGEFDVTQQLIVVGDEREIHGNALVHRRIGQALGAPVAVALVGDFFADGREVLLAVGIVNMGSAFTTFASQVHASTQQIAGRAHLGRRDIGLWEHPAAPQHGDFLGVDRVVFGLAAMDGLHREGMPEDKRHTVFSTEVRKPVPGQHACGRQDDLIAGRGKSREQRLWGGGHVTVQQRFTSLVEDAHVHGAGVEIDPTVKRVLFGGESPGGLLLVRYEGFGHSQQTMLVCWGGGLNKYHPPAADALQRPLPLSGAADARAFGCITQTKKGDHHAFA